MTGMNKEPITIQGLRYWFWMLKAAAERAFSVTPAVPFMLVPKVPVNANCWFRATLRCQPATTEAVKGMGLPA